MGLEHFVRGGVPQPEMLGPACCEKTVVPGVKGDPSRRKAVVLRSLVHLSCVFVHSASVLLLLLLLMLLKEIRRSARAMKDKTVFERTTSVYARRQFVEVIRVLSAEKTRKEEA